MIAKFNIWVKLTLKSCVCIFRSQSAYSMLPSVWASTTFEIHYPGLTSLSSFRWSTSTTTSKILLFLRQTYFTDCVFRDGSTRYNASFCWTKVKPFIADCQIEIRTFSRKEKAIGRPIWTTPKRMKDPQTFSTFTGTKKMPPTSWARFPPEF